MSLAIRIRLSTHGQSGRCFFSKAQDRNPNKKNVLRIRLVKKKWQCEKSFVDMYEKLGHCRGEKFYFPQKMAKDIKQKIYQKEVINMMRYHGCDTLDTSFFWVLAVEKALFFLKAVWKRKVSEGVLSTAKTKEGLSWAKRNSLVYEVTKKKVELGWRRSWFWSSGS